MKLEATTHEVAKELRKLADGLDRVPETMIGAPSVYFLFSYRSNQIQAVRALVDALPRPISQKFEGDFFVISHDSDAMSVTAQVKASIIGKLVTPATLAVYEYDPSVLGIKNE